MNFTEWYKEKHGFEWEETDAEMYGFAIEMTDKYEDWCKEHNIKPIWNG